MHWKFFLADYDTTEAAFSGCLPKQGKRAVVGSAIMVQLYSLDSQEEENIDQQHTRSPDSVALALERDHRTGIRMIQKVPQTFGGQSSWFG